MSTPLIAVTTPTLNRPDTHALLYRTFASQDWQNKMLFVLDESAQPSPFFSQCTDPRVVYVHAPMTYKRDVTRIGAARNYLCQLARNAGATYIAHADDDDHYDKSWLRTMRNRLGSAGLIKLAVFRLLVEKGDGAGTIWQWDVREMGGQHYALKGSETPEPVDIGDDADPTLAEAYRGGFGWSYMFRADLQERIPFPDEGTEDYPWFRACKEAGVRIVEVDDLAHLALHVVGADSNSMLFPQRYVGKQAPGVGSQPRSLRAHATWRMLGAVANMYELPDGKDIQFKPGATYQVLACVKNSHNMKQIAVRASSWGVTIGAARDNVDAAEFGVQPAPNGYRLIHVVAKAERAGRCPWKTPKLVIFDKSRVIKAWCDQAPSTGPQLNAQLQPTAGVATLGPRGRDAGMAGLAGFGGGRCPTCTNYAWSPEMGPSMKAIDGTMHHPSCSRLVGLAPSKMERRIQRMQARRGLPVTGVIQINRQLSPR